MAPCLATVRMRATCVLLLLLWADVRPSAVAGQAPPEPDAADAEALKADAATIEADSDGRGNSTRGGGSAARSKVLSTIDCQICEATCRVKCLINNLFQWGTCYHRCKADNCNDWCR